MTVDPKHRYTRGRGLPMILPGGLGTAHHPPGVPAPVTAVDRLHVIDALAALTHD
jgi:hypothetical protein